MCAHQQALALPWRFALKRSAPEHLDCITNTAEADGYDDDTCNPMTWVQQRD